jgi:Ferritin-like
VRVDLDWRKASKEEADATSFDVLPSPLNPMSRRDEFIFLLHAAAEIEHALLVQYLYAAYSLAEQSDDPTQQALLDNWFHSIHDIARQEMGHLATVQNLLWAVGGPLNFDREDFPFRSTLYPFHFSLERITRDSLAKYVIAEMPPLTSIPAELRPLVMHIMRRAQLSNLGDPINRVGSLYAKLGLLAKKLKRSDFCFDTAARWQARSSDFGFVGPDDPDVLSKAFIAPVSSRADVIRAIELVAEQGEGGHELNDQSHFLRLIEIFEKFPESDAWPGTWVASRPVPTNPIIAKFKTAPSNAITSKSSAQLALLANLRYRITLSLFLLYFHIDFAKSESIKVKVAGWLKEEMRQALGFLAVILPSMTRQKPPLVIGSEETVAAAPFELPYTLSFPSRPSDRWRLQASLIRASRKLCKKILQLPELPERARQTVEQILVSDDDRMTLINQMIRNGDS